MDINDNGGAGGGASSRPDGYAIRELFENSNLFAKKMQEQKICMKKNRNQIINILCEKYEIGFDELYKIITFDEEYILNNTLMCWDFYVLHEYHNLKEIKYKIIKLLYANNITLTMNNMKNLNAICTLREGS